MSETLIQPQSWDMLLDQYSHGEIFESHGSIERLPKLFRANVMTNMRSLLINYRGAVSFSRGTQSSNALTAKLSAVELFKMGLTLYLPDLRNVIDGAGDWLADFEKAIGVPAGSARLGAFVSPAGEGAPCHYDAEEVFSIQLIGEKIFEIAPMTEIENPVGKQYSPGRKPYPDLIPQVSENGFPNYDDLDFQRVEMKPGSVLYMPRGTWHRTTAHKDSLAISVIVNPPVLVDVVVEQLRQTLLQSAQWRSPVIALNKLQLTETLQSLEGIVTKLNAGLLQQYISPAKAQIDGIHSASRFICRPDARLVRKQGDATTLKIENRNSGGGYVGVAELSFTKPMLALAQWIVDQQGAFTMQACTTEFGHLSVEQVKGLLQLFLETKLLDLLLYPVLAE